MKMKSCFLRVVFFAAASVTAQMQTAQGQARALELQTSAVVNGNVIHLSDLLSDETRPQFRAEAASVKLGHAPQIGDVRVIRRTELKDLLRWYPALLASVIIPPEISITRASYPISNNAVKDEIARFVNQGRGNELDLERLNLHLPVQQRSLEQNPVLEVARATWDSRDHDLQFELRCADRTSCRRFLVRASVKTDSFSNLSSELESLTSRAPFRSAMSPRNPKRPSGVPLVQPGKRAMLIMEGGGIRITLPVICLQRGGRSQQVRVRELRGQRIFQAQVVGEKLLRAAL
jgi:Chaperone for flagella basal body P-ring formation